MAKNGGDSELALLTVDMVVELKNWIKFRLAHILNKRKRDNLFNFKLRREEESIAIYDNP